MTVAVEAAAIDELTRVLASEVPWDTVGEDATTTSFHILVRDGEAPVELHREFDAFARDLEGSTPETAVVPALDAARRLVDAGLVAVGSGGPERACTRTAGWLMVAAATRDPSAVVPLLTSPEAAVAVLRLACDGRLGPFARGLDGTNVTGQWREGGTLLVGIPGSGKTALLIRLAAGAPGPVVAGTPNVRDIARFAARSAESDVLVYDPGKVLEDATRPGFTLVTFDPVQQLVTDWRSARLVAVWISRAAATRDLVDESFWAQISAKLMAPYMLAAAVSGRTIDDVVAWIDQREEAEVMGILSRARAEAALDAFIGLVKTDIRLHDSVYATAATALEPFAGTSEHGELLDIDRFLTSGRTLVLLTDPANSATCLQAVGLVSRAIVEAKWRLADRTAGSSAPLLLLADEVTRNPGFSELPRLLSEGPSRGVQVVAATQTTAQLAVYGPAGAEEVVSSAARTVFTPGAMSEVLLRISPHLEADDRELTDLAGSVTEPEIDPVARIVTRPGQDMVTILESDGRLRRAHAIHAHRDPIWRTAYLDAAFARAGAAGPGLSAL